MPNALTLAAASLLALSAAPPCLAAEPAEAPLPLEVGDPAMPDMSQFRLRHGQLTLHQGFGLATLGGMLTTAGLGYYQANVQGSGDLRSAHLLSAGLTSGLYLTTATLALTAPPRAFGEDQGPWDTASLHRNLGWLHLGGMAATVGLGLMTEFSPLRTSPYHGIAAFTTLGLMALSAGVIAFGE